MTAVDNAPEVAVRRRLQARKFKDRAFIVWGLAATVIGLGALVALVGDLMLDGGHRLTWQFFTSFPSRIAGQAGIFPAWVGSLFVILTTALISVPVGVLSGVYLEEYAHKNWLTNAIEIAVNNLAGVPSIVYGLLALGLFVQAFAMGETVGTAGLTLALLILPIVNVATREAVRAVPREIRDAAIALGATKWQTTAHHVLPNALPGVTTGVIIGVSRALGETAPLICIGAATFVAFLPIKAPGDPVRYTVEWADPEHAGANPNATLAVRAAKPTTIVQPDGRIMHLAPGETARAGPGADVNTTASIGDAAASWLPWNWLTQPYTVMPIQMFNWTSRPEKEFRDNAAAAGLVLLAITLLMNGLAIWLRYRLRKRISW
jgi:phosphate transport system permease protein